MKLQFVIFHCCIIFQCMNRWIWATSTGGLYDSCCSLTVNSPQGIFPMFVLGMLIYIHMQLLSHAVCKSSLSGGSQAIFQSSGDALGFCRYCREILIARFSTVFVCFSFSMHVWFEFAFCYGWHHQLSGHEFEQTWGDSKGQRSLVCCSPRGRKELDLLW